LAGVEANDESKAELVLAISVGMVDERRFTAARREALAIIFPDMIIKEFVE
jgi:hypothetical protein